MIWTCSVAYNFDSKIVIFDSFLEHVKIPYVPQTCSQFVVDSHFAF